jgi:site-specific DNA-methyltransferase (adenine-specific)
MTWLKDHFANSLVAKKAPVSYSEDILLFSKNHDKEGLHPLRDYFKEVLLFVDMNLKQINNTLNHRRAEHTFYVNSTQYSLCTEQTYQELIDTFNIDKMDGFKPFDELSEINSVFNSVFNLWEGKKFKSNILEYKKDYTRHHPTQKPILLIEDLIKTFSNGGDLILDATMGSGSTGVACVNTGRNFIGIEMDEGYFNTAKERTNNAKYPET